MNFVNAEIAKIAVNSFVTMKISFANMISDICDRLPGADATAVTNAIGCDSRIGGKYLAPALGYGGPCFPRDNAAFAAMANKVGASAELAEATDAINRRQVERVVGLVRSLLPGGTVGILGLSYKPDDRGDRSQPRRRDRGGIGRWRLLGDRIRSAGGGRRRKPSWAARSRSRRRTACAAKMRSSHHRDALAGIQGTSA